MILLIAFIVRLLAYRAINRVTRLTVDGVTPAALGPLRAPARRAFSRGLSGERRAQRTQAIGSLLKSISSFLIFGIAAVLILAELGIDIAPLLASAGIAGVALAFGAQNLVRDFLAGIFMTLEDQFGVGDSVDLGSATGTVVAVGLRTTTVRAADGTIWHVRNGEVLRVGNSSQGEAVVSIELPLRYDADAERAGTIALEQAARIAQTEEFTDSIVEEPTAARHHRGRPPGPSPSGSAPPSGPVTRTRYLRAVRAAIRAAFDEAREADPAADFSPPVVTPPGQPG